MPRNIVSVEGGRCLFLRSDDGDDPTLSLWALDPADGEETKVIDPASVAGETGDELPEAERARRERARESGAGHRFVLGRSCRLDLCFSLGGTLFVVDLQSGEVVIPDIAGAVFDPRVSPDGTKVAFVVGSEVRVFDTVLAAEDDGDERAGISPRRRRGWRPGQLRAGRVHRRRGDAAEPGVLVEPQR